MTSGVRVRFRRARAPVGVQEGVPVAGGDAGRPEHLAGPGLLPDMVEGLLARRGESGRWTVRRGGFWCSVHPDGTELREQGWKLHLSATPVSAALVLAVATEVLTDARVSWKFAGTLEHVGTLTDARAPRGGGGKFLTVYPDDDAHFLRLAEDLHRATDGLPGPGILSDRRYRPGSLVHYRYGAFHGVPTLTNDGCVEAMLRGPDGTPEPDRREAWVTTPPWAESVVPEPAREASPPAARRATAVMLDDRYVVRKAIRHAYKGGVYRGTDRHTGREVVIKEARPHVGGRLNGQDCRDMLRHEHGMLQRLAPLGLGPCAVGAFTQQGNDFLVQEFVEGESLRAWVLSHPARDLADVVRVALRITGIVEAVHGAGLVLRDLNPNNLMVTPEGDIRLIDVETVVPRDTAALRQYTPGYVGPEVTAPGAPRSMTVEPSLDLYSLGALLLHLVTGVDPVFLPDEGEPRPADDRMRPLVRSALADHPWAAPLLPAILGLTAADPAGRWSTARVRTLLAELDGAAAVPATADTAVPVPGDAARDRLIGDGLRYLLRTRGTGTDGHLWPLAGFAATNDPLNVQHGAAGVLAVLTRAAAATGADPALREAVAGAAAWIHERVPESSGTLPPGSPVLPGLHFGRSGTAWALLDAGRLLGDDAVTDAGLDLARRVPVDWPNRDICHGAAGAGMAQLAFWRATGETAFLDRATAAAEAVLAAAEDHPAGVIWPIPADFASELAGRRQFGFAHGVAGIGAFLLATGEATGREDLLATARTAGDTLTRIARTERGAATWPAGDSTADGAPGAVNWCNGSSGVGTFLIRLWRATGAEHYREACELAAVAVRRSIWRGTPVACHGLAGEADFLLDCYAALGDDRYLRWAQELATGMELRAVERDGLRLLPDETLNAVCVSYGTGLAGALGTLLRLRDGGTRLWMPDTLAVRLPSSPADMAGTVAP
jgi:hypothetical protein